MAEDARPPIFGTAVEGWRFTFAALSRMPVVLGVGLLAVIAVNTLTIPVAPDPAAETTVGGKLIDLAISVVNGFFLTPVAIAVHRFVLLGEVTDRYTLNPREPRFLQFFSWTALYQLLIGVPGVIATLERGSTGGTGITLLCLALIGSVWLLLLFPAIAVDARGAAWQNSVADTKGHWWRIAGTFVLAVIPLLAVLLPILFVVFSLIPEQEHSSVKTLVMINGIVSVASVLGLCVFAAVASRLFAAFANRLNIPFSKPGVV